jgi:hypothetical protein
MSPPRQGARFYRKSEDPRIAALARAAAPIKPGLRAKQRGYRMWGYR